MRRLTPDEFGHLFETFHSAFRWERLQVYSIPREADDLAAFLRGEPVGPNRPWGEVIRAARARDATMRRVRLITTPLTDYTRYEIAKYRHNLTAGEDIRVLIDPAEIPEGGGRDFWLLDDTRVARMHYDPAGRFLGADLTTGDLTRKTASDLARARELRDWALTNAVPLADYLAVANVRS